MSLDPTVAGAIVTASVTLSGGVLAWATQIAKARGEKAKEADDRLREVRADREALIVSLQKELERVGGRRDDAESECEAHREEAALWRDAYDAQTLDIRLLKTYARTAYADCLEHRPGYPVPPVLAPRPDPMTLKRKEPKKE